MAHHPICAALQSFSSQTNRCFGLEKAREFGLRQGLRYVYLGNVPGHSAENTYCPGCGELIIRRHNYRVLEYHMDGDRCRLCGAAILECLEKQI